MGKTINYSIKHDVFENYTKTSCYWGGFLAADGYIGGGGNKLKEVRYLSFGLKESDLNQVLKFKSFVETDKELITNVKGKFISYQLNITSSKICGDLSKNYNLKQNKSLTLLPPPITNNILKDSFIIGYIDGDGCIFYNNRPNLERQQSILGISIIGTIELLNFIKDRFEKILNVNLSNCIKRKRNNNKNTFVLSISNKRARDIYIHYYKIEVPKLNRKWTEEKFNHCINWKKTPSRIKIKIKK